MNKQQADASTALLAVIALPILLPLIVIVGVFFASVMVQEWPIMLAATVFCVLGYLREVWIKARQRKPQGAE